MALIIIRRMTGDAKRAAFFILTILYANKNYWLESNEKKNIDFFSN